MIILLMTCLKSSEVGAWRTMSSDSSVIKLWFSLWNLSSVLCKTPTTISRSFTCLSSFFYVYVLYLTVVSCGMLSSLSTPLVFPDLLQSSCWNSFPHELPSPTFFFLFKERRRVFFIWNFSSLIARSHNLQLTWFYISCSHSEGISWK